ncbi:hypothetical protein [Fibrella arboris]|uniref:hypothetical protein n=1 Tax=Fibrella arboris TaxID=3242486 RepID=UPI003522F7DC
MDTIKKSAAGRRRVYCLLFSVATLLFPACQPKAPEPLSIGKVWKAQVVKEGDQVVYTQGGTGNTQPGYVNFRLDLTNPQKVTLIDRDGKTIVGTWSVSPDNKRLILENLKPIPSSTIGTIEYYITTPPTPGTLPLQRTAESRKTGNTVNDYQLVPLE